MTPFSARAKIFLTVFMCVCVYVNQRVKHYLIIHYYIQFMDTFFKIILIIVHLVIEEKKTINAERYHYYVGTMKINTFKMKVRIKTHDSINYD